MPEERWSYDIEILDLVSSEDSINLPLAEVIEQLEDALESIPPELRETAVLKFRCYGDYPRGDLSVSYAKPETDEAFTARLAREKAQRDRDAANREIVERRTYEALKEKFG
jgi:hypothetical protein